MHFLAPSLLLGLFAAALPAIIHRIGRRRARPIRFAAMELLLRAEREVSARRRLRDTLLLVARTGLAMALPLAFARPFAEVRSDLPAETGRSQSAVVVLDDSASMRRRSKDEGGTPFGVARARAREVIEHLSADSEIALVLASEGSAAPIAELASDRTRVLAALDATTASARRADFGAALRRATQILGSSTRADRLIYVATDLQAAGWDDVKPPDRRQRSPGRAARRQRRRGLDQPGGRRALRRAGARGGDPGDRGGRRDRQLLAGGGPEPGGHAGARRRRGGARLRRRPGARPRPQALRPHHRRRQRARGRGDDRQGRLPARRSARLPGRGLARAAGADRRRRPAHGPHRGRDVLPRGGAARGRQRLRGHQHAPRRSGRARSLRLRRHLPGQRRTARRRRSPPRSSATSSVAAASSSLSATASTPTPGTNRSRRSSRSRSASSEAPPRSPARAPRARRSTSVPPSGWRQSIAATRCSSAFPAHGDGLSSARFFQYMLLSPLPDAPGRQIVLRYESGAPALVEADVGRGRVLLLTTTVDREWTDLPIRPGFLPLVQETARYLAGAPSGEAAAAVAVGQKREIALEPDDRRIEVVPPTGESRWLTPPPWRRRARPPGAHLRRDRRAGLLPRACRARRRHDQRAPRRRVRGQPRPARVGPGAPPRRRGAPIARPPPPPWARRPAAGSSSGTRSARR